MDTTHRGPHAPPAARHPKSGDLTRRQEARYKAIQSRARAYARRLATAANLLALPPGGWGSTQQAIADLRDILISYQSGAARYEMPGGGRDGLGAAIEAWLAEARAAGCVAHPDRAD